MANSDRWSSVETGGSAISGCGSEPRSGEVGIEVGWTNLGCAITSVEIGGSKTF